MIEGFSMGKIHMINHEKTSPGRGIVLVTLCGPGCFGCPTYFSICLAKLGLNCVMEGAVDEPSSCRQWHPLGPTAMMLCNTNQGYYDGLETSQ